MRCRIKANFDMPIEMKMYSLTEGRNKNIPDRGIYTFSHGGLIRKRLKVSTGAIHIPSVSAVFTQDGISRWILAQYRSKRRKADETLNTVNCSFSTYAAVV